jgi:hypothetical protein
MKKGGSGERETGSMGSVGSVGSKKTQASSPIHYPLFTIHYPLFPIPYLRSVSEKETALPFKVSRVLSCSGVNTALAC